jgi:hypothetical protein
MIALPTMLRAGYDPRISSGIVCTAGTLGQIIPPSTLLIILADVMSNSYQQAQYEQGKFAVEALSVGQFFAAALFPGLLLVGLYLIYILMRGLIRPQDMPPATLDEPRPSGRQVLGTVFPPVLLIFAVLGAILGGVATPTEAASVGAIGAIMMAGARTGVNPLIIVAGAAALILLAVLSRLYPVRLQRSDLELAQYAAGCLYILLAIVSAAGILFALRAIFRERTIHSAVDSTLTMTASHAGRCDRRIAVLHGLRVHPRILPRLRGNLGHRPAARDAIAHPDGARPDLAWHSSCHQPADELPDPALRLFAVLSARRGTQGGYDRTHLLRSRAVYRPAVARDAAGLARTCRIDLAACFPVLTGPFKRPATTREFSVRQRRK